MPLARTFSSPRRCRSAAALAVAQTPLGRCRRSPAPGATAERSTVQLSAVFAGEQRPVRSGLVWRVYEDKLDGSQPALVEKSTAPTPSFSLRPGNYVVHAAYGFAGRHGASRCRAAPWSSASRSARAPSRWAAPSATTPIPPNRLAVSVYVPIGSNSEGRLVVGNVRGGEIVRLPEGTYHVVSTYGESNAITRADLKVEAGRITEATLNHRAATVTLKLVAAAGGDAFAGTAFSVLTPGGDVIREAIGAFPSVTLAEGDYVLIARHEGQVYTREFKVESGLDRDIEVAQKN